MQKLPFDPTKMRLIEALTREMGHLIGAVCRKAGYGFTLFIFSFDGSEISYMSNANRADMLKVMQEFINKQNAGMADQTSEQKN